MAFSWEHYLELGDNLHSQIINGNPIYRAHVEAVRRTIISRAYYAAFRATRDYLEQKNIYIPCRTGIDHQNVKIKSDKVDPIIKANLTRLGQLRTNCDYDNPFPLNEVLNDSLVQDSIYKAKKVIQILNSKP